LPFAALSPSAADLAAEALRSANNGFVLLCAALVLLMTPALSLFYGGFVRSRNVLNTMVMSFAAMAVVSVLWVLFGYSLVFAPSTGPLAPFIGGLQWAGLANWAEPWGEGQLSQGAVAVFQLTFAIITPAWCQGRWWNACTSGPGWPSWCSGAV
jgi:Amt family ammonium transporter